MVLGYYNDIKAMMSMHRKPLGYFGGHTRGFSGRWKYFMSLIDHYQRLFRASVNLPFPIWPKIFDLRKGPAAELILGEDKNQLIAILSGYPIQLGNVQRNVGDNRPPLA